MKPLKRIFDFIGSVFGLLFLAPLFGLLALLIKWDDGGPIFFRQERIGYRGKPFRMVKFRTMRVVQPPQSKLLTIGDDPRITRVGKFLRKTKMDEFPQLINVFKGEMSLVGPRPEVARYVDKYNAAQRKVLDLIPGITDPASLLFRNESDLLALAEDPEGRYVSEIMPQKIRINLAYAETADLFSDLKIILRTLRVLAPITVRA